MTWSAPSCFSFSAFSAEDVVAMTMAPAALAIYQIEYGVSYQLSNVGRGNPRYEISENGDMTYLKPEDADTSSSLDQNDLAGFDRVEAVKGIPARKSRAGKSATLDSS
jgi:hypothetical protein